MHIEELRTYCLGLPQVEEKFPFDQSTLVFYIAGKMFCLCNINEFDSLNLKCDPDQALELRATYEAVTPGYHMNKKHWNTIKIHQDVKDSQIKEWIKDSYNLVILTLPKSKRPELLKDN
ncbi:MmcQ/YjbR family DNA-binding protein [Empedobacter brevis]|uniref:MmcQ/YjbR family DNA-binding protein n=1 Tax=Empedobacter brevis TaxID=247 RepID=UPI00123CF40B|nr:MmcQ/YjbR family DNA-binding protein [Empedobacter brevis]QES93065.1 MmcQ/YjbR family DNA-binding protein [Empedobacter brevis]QHC84886.1 MmcQ-like protein [Empedobacter brevis]